MNTVLAVLAVVDALLGIAERLQAQSGTGNPTAEEIAAAKAQSDALDARMKAILEKLNSKQG